MDWKTLGIGKETDLSIFTDTMVEMTWIEVANAVEDNNIVLLPIGIIEEHGPHMDLSPDIYMAYLFCKLLKQKLHNKNIQSIIAPPFYWGVDFFNLRTRLAGEVLQKFINYQIKVAIVGDFTIYSSKSLKDFIYESNKGSNIFFLPNEEQAIERLSIG